MPISDLRDGRRFTDGIFRSGGDDVNATGSWLRNSAVILLALTMIGGAAGAEALAQPAADLVPAGTADRILINGKIVTVDVDFLIAEALAVQGERILAVGTDAEISELSGPATQVLDLDGRTVIPGLIDNHQHFVRAAEQWYRHVRWDEVYTREQALSLLRERAQTLPAGEWVVVLGGWVFEQFRDDRSPFTRAELDAALPDHPLYVQLGYSRGYANSLALRATGIDENTAPDGSGVIVKDEEGRLTGEFIGAGAFMRVAGSIPPTPPAVWDESLRGAIRDYLKSGLTALLDVGGNTVTALHYAALQRAATAGRLPMRVFHTLNSSNGVGPGVDDIIEALSRYPPRSGDDRLGRFAYGEMTYAGVRDGAGPDWQLTQESLADYRRIAENAAERGWQIHEHSTRDDKIASILSVFEDVNRRFPVRELRWTLAHCEDISDISIDRAIELGVLFALHSSAAQGAVVRAELADPSVVRRMPPIRVINEKGGIWGLGSDGTVVSGYNPFHNLGWAVTGKDKSGGKYLDETVSRKDALIAHTRSNAYMLFKEEVLGSLEPGKYADLVVLDRDYLTVATDEIFNIKPVLTMVGGEIVFSGVW
jgi:hypothetical protein